MWVVEAGEAVESRPLRLFNISEWFPWVLEGKPQRIVGAGALDSPQSERFQLMFAAAPRHRPTDFTIIKPFDKSKFEALG